MLFSKTNDQYQLKSDSRRARRQTAKRLAFFLCLAFFLAQATPSFAKAPTLPIRTQKAVSGKAIDLAKPLPLDITIKESTGQKITALVKMPEEFPLLVKEGESDEVVQAIFAANSSYLLTNVRGEPHLPYYSFRLMVPSDAKNFKIASLKTKIVEKKLEKPLEGKTAKKSIILIGNVSKLRDITMLTVYVYPVSYDSKTQTINHCEALELDLTFNSRSLKNSVVIQNADKNVFHKIYKSAVANYAFEKSSLKAPVHTRAQEGEYRILTSQQILDPNYDTNTQFFPDYLVIRSQAFINSASFNTWLDHRISEQGGAHTIGVISLETLYSAYSSGTNQDRIKSCISFLYQNWRQTSSIPDLVYLLLIGDADYGQDTQNWFMPTWDSNNDITGITGDNKYGCLTGNDDLPELLIGRLPVKNETELATILNKTISFETTLPQGENHWGTRHLFLGGSDTNTFGPTTNGARDTLIKYFQESDEFVATDSYNPNYPDFSFTNADPAIFDLINDKNYLTISYNGDAGEETGWMPENVDVAALTNSAHLASMVISASSRTARFDWPTGDCYGEQWLKNYSGGAVAFFGPSRKTFGMSYSADESILSGIYLKAMATLGSAVLQSKIDPSFSENDDVLRYNLLGDPSTSIEQHLAFSVKPEIRLDLTAQMSSHPLTGEALTLKDSIQNAGRGPAEDLTLQLFYIDYAGQQSPVGSTQNISALASGQKLTFDNSWIFEEHFWEEFRIETNMIDELSEYNNIYQQSPHFIEYPMHFNVNNTTGIENGSYEHPFTKFKYSGPNYYHFGFDFIINNNRPGCVAKVYVYPGLYGDVTGNAFSIYNMELKGEGNVSDILVSKDAFSVSGYTLIENMTFQDVNPNLAIAPIVIDGKTSTVRGCVFKDNPVAISCQNTWSWNGYKTSANLTNNIFYDNGSALRVADDEITVDLINNVMINNNRFLDISLGDDPTNQILIKNNIIRDNINNTLSPVNAQITNNYNNTDINYLLLNGTNNIDLDPQFVSPANSDFHLLVTSPCINAGDPDPAYQDRDGSVNDMGAYGGPLVEAPLTIISPAHDQTLVFRPTEPIAFPISWQSTGIAPNEMVHIQILDEEKASSLVKKHADTKRLSPSHRSRLKTSKKSLSLTKSASGLGVILDATVPNVGFFNVPPNVVGLGDFVLVINVVNNPDVVDQRSFKILNNYQQFERKAQINYIE